MKNSSCVGVAVVLALGFLGCQQVADQTFVRKDHQVVANPIPAERDFAGINKKHKILIAAFDDGVDYNHPYLINNLHFTLDEKGRPESLGKDYLAMDQWASSRVVNTEAYFFEYLPKEKQDEVLVSKKAEEYDWAVTQTSGAEICNRERVLSSDKRLEKYLHLYRDLRAEGTHGTHVAGLMTYDREDFGLLSFRILPYHQTKKDEEDERTGKMSKFVENFADAAAHARKQGVRVVNLSLGGGFAKPDDDEDKNELERFNNLNNIVVKRLSEIVKAYPEILFVAAAGNDGAWSDNISRVQFPCGIEAPNILCVGALGYDASLASFTNIPLNNIDLVFAAGTKIVSLAPSDRCVKFDDDLRYMLDLCTLDKTAKAWVVDPAKVASELSRIMGFFDKCQSTKNLLVEMSGTSMATPLVVHLAAEIFVEKPELSAVELIGELKKRARKARMGERDVYKLLVKKPSWYKTWKAAPDTRGDGSVFESLKSGVGVEKITGISAAESQNGDGFFEFILP